MSDRILFMLSRIQHVLSTHVRRELNEKGIVLSPGQIGILFTLEHGAETTMGELSGALEMDNAAASRLVDKLEKQGLVERFINPDDRRQIKIRMTPKGDDQARAAKAVVKGVNTRLRDGFTIDEIAVYNRVNRAIIEKFSIKESEK